MTASDGARLHQKRLIIGSSSRGAETGHIVHLAVGGCSGGGVEVRGHRDMC